MSRNPSITLHSLPCLLALLSAVPLAAMAATSAPSSLPQVDFSKMGTVGLGGSFTGLDWWSDTSPFASSSNSSSATFSTNGDTVFVQATDGSYRPLGSTNSGGSIHSLCWSNHGDSNGTLYIGGSFSSLSGTSATNLASYSLTSSIFSALSSGVSGPVEALYCDNTKGEVWVGGSFAAPTGTGGNVGLWSTSSTSWSPVPFGGLNGAVYTIDPSSNGNSLYFGGHFTTSFASNSSLSSSNNVTTTGNITSFPSAPNGTLTTGNSGYLTPVTIPYTANTDPYVQITIDAHPSTSQRLYSDPHVLVCPGEAIWLAQDNTAATVDIQGVNYMRANGIRVVNGLVQGRGTKTFSFTSLPDNSLITLTYTDPSTGRNQTCSDSCPLSTDSSVAAQDYIFDTPRDLIGLEMQLKGWIGSGAGLSSVQLLSDGAYGSAVANTNKPLCPGNLPSSSSQQSGDWSVQSYTTNDPRIITYYLTTNVTVGSTTKPSITFYPYVSSAAIYNVYIVIPGCQSLGDCGSRTSIDIEVFPVLGGMGWTSTVSEQVQDDTRTLVYSGPVDASTDTFTPTVLLTLPQSPAAPSSGNQYTLVADAIEMVLVNVTTSGSNTSRSAGSSINGTTTGNITMSSNGSVAFGLFEYVRSSSSNSSNAATSVLSNTTETAIARLGMVLDSAYNSSTSTSGWSINAIATIDNTVYVAGDFAVSGNYSNVVALDISTGQSKSLALMGLNGAVNAAAVVGGSVYFGGQFSSTASGGTRMEHLAKWDPKAQAWSALAGGVNGYVTDLIASPTSAAQLVVVGNFSTTASTDGSSASTGGYAVYDTSSSSWVSSGILFGNLSTAATSTAKNTYLAGRVSGSSSNSVSGVAILRSGSGGSAEISSLSNVNFGTTGSAASPSSSAGKRSLSKSSLTRNFLSRFTDPFATHKDELMLAVRAAPPTISSAAAPAPAVLAGAFWKNSSTEITILGGNFTSTNGSTKIEGVAFYADGQPLSGPNPPVEGLVRALNVKGSVLYIGGQNVNVSGVGTGLLAYNLDSSSWVTGGMSPLNPSSGSSLSVNAIRTRGNTNTVLVAGNFATAGSLSCAGVCLWDTSNAQWSTLGAGLSAGEVRSIDFAGDDADTLVAAGSFALSTGDVAYVATYSFGNTTWTPLGSLPGPALAVAVDDKNSTNIFAAGYASDGTPYLQNWNGKEWSPQQVSLATGSIVQQLAFVPMSNEHDAAGSIEKDRMLMVSGDLYLEDTGNATSALYDGSKMYPYLVGSTSSGGLGSGSQLFWSINDFSFNIVHHLARGLVVLVAIAIATGLILLLILIFFLIACITRRRERDTQPKEMYEKEGSDISSTHQNVFNNVQAALEQSLVGAGIGAGVGGMARNRNTHTTNRESDQSMYTAGGAGEEEEEDEGRETTMRYDFDGPELQPGEMAMKAGQRIIILDDVQSDEWWYAQDPATGREGVVPATYVW